MIIKIFLLLNKFTIHYQYTSLNASFSKKIFFKYIYVREVAQTFV